MTATALAIEDMHCGACRSKIAAALTTLPLVRNVKFNEIRRHVVVEHADTLTTNDLITSIENCGYHPSLLQNAAASESDNALLKRLGIAGLAAMQVMMAQVALYAGVFTGIEDSFRQILEFTALIFCIPVVSYCAIPFYVNGVIHLRRGVNMDTPIALAIAIAFSVSLYNTLSGAGEVYYDSVVMFAFLILGARYLDQRLRLRLQLEDAVLSALPKECTVIVDGQARTVPSRTVTNGDTLWIGEGAQLPVDGELQAESAVMEEALITGESEWRTRSRGETLYAGTFNRGPAFELVATSSVDDSCLAAIDELATTALDKKHAMAHVADRVAQVFIPAILAIAVGTYLVWRWLDPGQAMSATLAVLVVSCPCALSLATPAALSAALARLRQAGILVKNSRALERLPSIAAVMFDKTGTLTAAQPKILQTQPLESRSMEDCLNLARSLQVHSSHPLARAFATHPGTTLPASDVRIVTGQGIEGVVDGHRIRLGTPDFCHALAGGKSDAKSVYMSIDDEPSAVFQLEQGLRDDARATVDSLQHRGLTVEMASGDDTEHCARVADELGIEFNAATSPLGKVAAIERHTSPTMFIGDGINDVPALANAGVSVATMETNELVKSKADVVLLTKRLGALVDLLNIGRKTRTIMQENLSWAAIYNVVAIPLAALGYAPPWVAALGMSLSSILVMLNASRVLRQPLWQGD
jgi:Cu2+-exporting ATPase